MWFVCWLPWEKLVRPRKLVSNRMTNLKEHYKDKPLASLGAKKIFQPLFMSDQAVAIVWHLFEWIYKTKIRTHSRSDEIVPTMLSMLCLLST